MIASKYELIDGKIKFTGMIKRPNKFRPDPTVDRIMSSMGDSNESGEGRETETSGFVTIRIPSDDSPDGKRPVDIGLNGQNYRLYRDQLATVPKEIAEILANAEKSVSIMPAAKGEKVVCQVDPNTGTYFKDKGPTEIVNRRFNLEIEEED